MSEAPTCLTSTSGAREKKPLCYILDYIKHWPLRGFILTAFSAPQSATPSAHRLIAMQPPGAAAGLSGSADSEGRSVDDSSVYLLVTAEDTLKRLIPKTDDCLWSADW